eukprot:360021-Chlamydomonas_euryale.AAC.2
MEGGRGGTKGREAGRGIISGERCRKQCQTYQQRKHRSTHTVSAWNCVHTTRPHPASTPRA